MCARLKQRAWLALLPMLGIAAAFGIKQASAFLGGFCIWWLASYRFAERLAKNIQPQHPKRMWAGIIKAELRKLLASVVALAVLGVLVWYHAAFMFAGYALGQLTLIGR